MSAEPITGRANPRKPYAPNEHMLGKFGPGDGTIEFYARVNALLDPSMTVLDLGAGRAQWFEDDPAVFRRDLRLLRGKVERVIAVDIDDAVLRNRSSDVNLLMKGTQIPLDDQSVDVIVADFVLEHIDDPAAFFAEVNRVLRSGGWFCARTPHKFHYVSFAARLIRNRNHVGVLRRAQPDRKAADVFPTRYLLNRLRDVHAVFKGYDSLSFVLRTTPSYFFGSKLGYRCFEFLHRIMPVALCGNLLVYLRKP